MQIELTKEEFELLRFHLACREEDYTAEKKKQERKGRECIGARKQLGTLKTILDKWAKIKTEA